MPTVSKAKRQRVITKSPIELTRMALEAAEKALPKYSTPKSRQDFTQAQLFAILVLKAFFNEDYRGIIDLLEDFGDLRKVLGITKLPHYSTLCYAEERIFKKKGANYFKEPSLIDARIWDLLESAWWQQLLWIQQDSNQDTYPDTIITK